MGVVPAAVMHRKPFRHLPNLLTLLRIVAIPLLVWLLEDPGPSAAWTAMLAIVANAPEELAMPAAASR